jgi:hypothetical protein
MGRTVSNTYSENRMWQVKVMRPSSFKPDFEATVCEEASLYTLG